MSKNCWFGTFDIDHFRIIERDLAIGNVPIFKADASEVSRVNSLAMERHLAINWLLGDSEIYSETEDST